MEKWYYKLIIFLMLLVGLIFYFLYLFIDLIVNCLFVMFGLFLVLIFLFILDEIDIAIVQKKLMIYCLVLFIILVLILGLFEVLLGKILEVFE